MGTRLTGVFDTRPGETTTGEFKAALTETGETGDAEAALVEWVDEGAGPGLTGVFDARPAEDTTGNLNAALTVAAEVDDAGAAWPADEAGIGLIAFNAALTASANTLFKGAAEATPDARPGGATAGELGAALTGTAGALFTGTAARTLDALLATSVVSGSFFGTGVLARVTILTAVFAALGLVTVRVVGSGPQFLHTVTVVVQPAGTAGVGEPGRTVVSYTAFTVARPVWQTST